MAAVAAAIDGVGYSGAIAEHSERKTDWNSKRTQAHQLGPSCGDPFCKTVVRVIFIVSPAGESGKQSAGERQSDFRPPCAAHGFLAVPHAASAFSLNFKHCKEREWYGMTATCVPALCASPPSACYCYRQKRQR